MAALFSLQCLGRPGLYAPDGRAVRFKTKKHLALLIYLAVEPRVPHRRDRLSDLLWGMAEARAGRHSLATALSVLRARLGRSAFEGGRDWIRFVGEGLDIDLERLAAGEVLETDLLPALDVGGFLEDFEIEDAPGFDLWRDQQRARWQPTIRDALTRLIDRCRRTGDFGRIEGYADRMLRLDELSEEGIRAKMEARAFAGDRLTALKLYEEWRERLGRELAAIPSAILEGMALRLRRRGWERENTKEIPPVPTDHWKGRAFVGRGPEYRTLYEAWESSKVGVPRHVLVLGDSGVGKSTVVGRLATAAGLEGAAVSRVQGHALEQKVPYAALTGLIEELIERPGASGTAPEALAELAETVVAVRERFPKLPPVSTTEGETARIRFSESVEHLLRNVAEEQPVVLVVDDFHHVDDASAAVLHFLMRRLIRVPVMVVLAARTGELAALPNGQRVVENSAQLHLHLLQLAPLSDQESGWLIDSLVPPGSTGPVGATRRALIRAAAGFPLALELLVRDWQGHADQCLALSLQAMTEDLPHGVAPADAYRQVFERMYQGLHPLTRSVLNLAGILGSRLNDTRMFSIGDLTLGQTMAGLARLTELRVLRDDGRELVFVNELIRAQAYLAVPSPVRRTLHGTIADRLLADDRLGRSIPGLEIAWHLIRSGRGEEAVPFALSGAREAIAGGAPAEAEGALRSMINQLRGERKGEALYLYAQALQEQGRMRDSITVLERRTDFAGVDRNALQLLQLRALRFLSEHKDCDFNACMENLAALLRSATDESLALGVAHTLAPAVVDRHLDSIDDTLLHALKRFATTPSHAHTFAQGSYAHAVLLARRGAINKGRTLIKTGIRVLHEAGIANSLLVQLLNGLGVLSVAEGQYDNALDDYLKALAANEHIQNTLWEQCLATNIALCYFRLGDYGSQIAWSTRALESNARCERPAIHLQALHYLSVGQAMNGLIGDAFASLRKGDSLAQALNPRGLQNWLLQVADIHQIAGDTKHAEAIAAEVVGHSSCKPLRSRRHAGAYARWVAIVGVKRFPGVAAQVLRSLSKRGTSYDWMDRVEIRCARDWLMGFASLPTKDEKPKGVQEFLGRLGLLDERRVEQSESKESRNLVTPHASSKHVARSI